MSDLARIALFTLLALVPGFAWLHHYYRKDVFEPEPFGLVLRLFGLGALTFLPVYLIQSFFIKVLLATDWIDPGWDAPMLAFSKAFFIVASTEEFFKFATVFFAIYGHPEFDEPMDGIVYGIACALGFATVENISYMLNYSSWILALRMVFSCFLHLACSGLAGYYLGRAKFSSGPGGPIIARGLCLAWLLHGTYDFVVFSGQFYALFLIILLLWWVKHFLDVHVEEALVISPFRK